MGEKLDNTSMLHNVRWFLDCNPLSLLKKNAKTVNEKTTAKYVPATTIIRRQQASFRFTGCKGSESYETRGVVFKML